VERVIYDHYRVTVIGSVPIKMQLSNSQEIETRKLAFCLRGEIDRTTLHQEAAQEVRGRRTTESVRLRRSQTADYFGQHLPCIHFAPLLTHSSTT
jgi:hypothetical protein